MRHYGIIGYPLGHSFSAAYFAHKFKTLHIDAEYSSYPLLPTEKEKMAELIHRLDGMNITLPYKQDVMPCLDRLDPTAAAIGAVNVVHRGTGYNTDYIGFVESIRPLLLSHDRRALVLGTGGASKAIVYGLRQLGIEPVYVSRSPKAGQLGYDDIDEEVLRTHTLIVNCTPLGMYPKQDTCPKLPYQLISNTHLLFDCVYNPEETLFLHEGRIRGARTKNGLEMLHIQAEEAWKIWNKNE